MAHLTSAQMAQYLARTLSPADVAALHCHLETCLDCRLALEDATFAGMQPVTAPLLVPGELNEVTESPHLTEDEMVAYVLGSMQESRRADSSRHVAKCEICGESVRAMESQRDFVSVTMPRKKTSRWFPVAALIAAALLIAAAIRFSSPPSATAPSQAVLASLRDGGQSIELDSAGNLRGLADASPAQRDLVRDILRQKSLPSGPKMQPEAPGVLLAPGPAAKAAFLLIGPINTRVLSDHPLFSWSSAPGAIGYQVIVTSEALDPLARSARITSTMWQSDVQLPRGAPLLWQVRAWLDAKHGGEMISVPAPPAPAARFEIVNADVAAQLEQLRSAPNGSHLLAAALCARQGLRDEASRELQLLANENPGSPLVGSLLSTLPR